MLISNCDFLWLWNNDVSGLWTYRIGGSAYYMEWSSLGHAGMFYWLWSVFETAGRDVGACCDYLWKQSITAILFVGGRVGAYNGTPYKDLGMFLMGCNVGEEYMSATVGACIVIGFMVIIPALGIGYAPDL